jgi:hypothetical protein
MFRAVIMMMECGRQGGEQEEKDKREGKSSEHGLNV